MKNQNEQLSTLISNDVERYLRSSGIGQKYWSVKLEEVTDEVGFKSEFLTCLSELSWRLNHGIGLVILGDIGCGKTSLIALLIHAIHNIGRHSGYKNNDEFIPLVWIPKYNIDFISMNALCQTFFDKDKRRIDELSDADILMIDDFGVEYVSDFSAPRVDELIEYRISQKLPTFITSNLTIDQLRGHEFYRRAVNRFKDGLHYKIMQMPGKSKRRPENVDKIVDRNAA
jgi:DNA replication protein DnaC